MRAIIIFALALLSVLSGGNQEIIAEEIHFLSGIIQEDDSRDRSTAWAIQYLHDLNEHWAVSFSWLNEGHFEDHHRDGHALQLWARTKPLGERVVLGAGIGPYQYYDTKWDREGASYVDSHGWGAIVGLSATWRMDNRWLFSVQSNFIETARSIDTFSILAGIGYQLEAIRLPAQSPPSTLKTADTPQNEITFFGGQTIVNSRNSENATSWMVEYRRSLGRYVVWSAGWLNEGNPDPINRNGLITQLWLVRSFFGDRLNLGVGAGPYVALDRRRPDNDELSLAGFTTLSAGYRFLPQWITRISWHRTMTDYNRDTDVLLGGIGYCF
ncbi:MAG: hypothetical protein WA133_11745 [Syntrophales bacterium]